jgi:hypothetical protein
MAALIQALDNQKQHGENNHPEYAWSTNIQEKIIQLDFQCVRVSSPQEMQELANKLDEMLVELTTQPKINTKPYLIMLYKLIAKTRDIKEGKGEYALAYMMIWTWYKYFPELAMNALYLFVISPNQDQKHNQEPYGSWKDIKYMCEYARQQGANTHHPMIQYCITLINMILYNDDLLYNGTDADVSIQTISLVSKWIARESSNKFGWLNEALATNYFYHYLLTAKTQESMQKAIRKCKTQYRQLIAKLNRHIDTIQIKQAGGRWAEIDHAKTTSITLVKNRKALLNLANPHKPNHHQKSNTTIDICRSTDPDRVQCATNFKQYLETLKQNNKTVKGKNIGLNTFTSEAIRLLQECNHNNKNDINNDNNKIETNILNSQWQNNSNTKNEKSLGQIIAIVDTSGSMSGNPLNAAIALGCRVAEKSCLGKRIMTFSADPKWINLDNCNTFTEMVQKINTESDAGYNTDFYKALNLILLAIEENKIPAEEVENMVLAIFSDMQIDDNLYITFNPNNHLYSNNDLTQCQQDHLHKEWNTLYETIKQQYHAVGMRLYNKPLNPPHILFWNLRNTTGFPAISTQQNMSMMSGFDPTVLNSFCEYGIDALKGMTAWSVFTEQLNNPRYLPMETAINKIIGV